MKYGDSGFRDAVAGFRIASIADDSKIELVRLRCKGDTTRRSLESFTTTLQSWAGTTQKASDFDPTGWQEPSDSSLLFHQTARLNDPRRY